jgi:hypothetical protein
MSIFQIKILNPKAIKLIQDLADLELISISQPKESGFFNLLAKLRSKAEFVPSLEEITKEVDKIRAERYEQKKSSNH